MAAVTLRIHPLDNQLAGFPISLSEGGVETARGLLPASALATAMWSLLAAVPVGAAAGKDLVATLLKATPVDRDQTEWASAGHLLFNCLLPPGPVRDRWTAIRNPNPELYLDVAADELVSVPWELACTAPPGVELRPALLNGLSRIRAPQPAVAVSSDWPLRILIVVGCAESEEQDLEVDKEVAQIHRRFLPLGRSVDVHCLKRPEKTALADDIRNFPPHVLHFAGHGGEDPMTNTPGLVIEAAAGQWVWKSDDVPQDVALWNWAPRFVFLNSCRSALGQTGTMSVQRSFLDSGAHAVLAMQADVRGDLAGRFAADLYEQCAQGKTVQVAVRDARVRLGEHRKSWKLIDWALPSLTATQEALTLMKPRPVPDAVAFTKCAEFEEAKFFANCHHERRLLTHWIYPAVPANPPAAPRNVIILSADRRSGKSHLLKWCMETWAIGGALVRYIEVDTGVSKDFLTVLRQIRDGDTNGNEDREFLHQGLPQEAFRRFNWELNNRLVTGEPGEWREAERTEPVIPDKGAPLDAKGEKVLEPAICARFHDALKTVAAQKPLVLVFDKFTGLEGGALVNKAGFEKLILHLFKPIADDKESQIRLVFSVTPAERDAFHLPLLTVSQVDTCTLPDNYTDDALVPLAAEMVWYQDERLITDLARMLLQLYRNDKSHQGVARLAFVYKAIKDHQGGLLAQIGRMR